MPLNKVAITGCIVPLTKKEVLMNISERPEMEVIVHYRANRDASTTYSVTQLQAAQVLQPHKHNAGTNGTSGIEILGGLYDLTLPSSVFANKGIYTVYIRPVEIRTVITDCGILSSLPNVKD